MDPDYIRGFADGESTFTFSIVKSPKSNTKFSVTLEFSAVAAFNSANEEQFLLIQNFFNLGTIRIVPATEKKAASMTISVKSIEDCARIRDFFLNYPLLTYKLVHFQIWCQVVNAMINKEHLTMEGLYKIVALKEHSPNGISKKLQEDFPLWRNYRQPAPLYNPDLSVMNLNWLAGFIQADGSFGCSIRKAHDTILGEQVQVNIEIAQHTRSLIVLERIKDLLGFGVIYIKKTKPMANFKIQDIENINLFIKNFSSTELYGSKKLDYIRFCKIVSLMNEGKHLTAEGLAQIKDIRSNMNSKRTSYDSDSDSE
jgi:hypothetical protein